MIVDNIVHGGPALPVPGHLSYAQFVIDQLREKYEKGVVMISGDTGHESTYKQLLPSIVDLATGLRRAGVRRGDIVAVISENREEFVVAVLAAVCCAATVTTINPSYSEDELKHTLNISKPNLLFVSEATMKSQSRIFKTSAFIKKIIQFDGEVEQGVIEYKSLMVPSDVWTFEPDDVQGATDTLFILYSSGTTGLPKGVMLTHLGVLYNAMQYMVTAKENVIRQSIAPWYHTYGLISTISYIVTGGKLIYFKSFNHQTYLNCIQKYKVDILVTVPPIVVFLAKSPFVEKYDLSSVRVVWCGAAPLSEDTIIAARKRMPNCEGIFQGYGLTETSQLAVRHEPTETETTLKKKTGSGGTPIPGIKLKVVDIETRTKLGPFQSGEICIKGPNMMKGYIGDEEASRQAFDSEGYLITGDIGYYDEDGYIFIVDRLKELIKYKGFQVPPAQVESALLSHGAVAECGVVGAPDDAAGELPTAFVVLKPSARAPTEQELLSFTSAKLSPEKRLRGGIIFVKEIPKNQAGKILRRVLKQMLIDKRNAKSKL